MDPYYIDFNNEQFNIAYNARNISRTAYFLKLYSVRAPSIVLEGYKNKLLK